MAKKRCYTAAEVAKILTADVDTDESENEEEGENDIQYQGSLAANEDENECMDE